MALSENGKRGSDAENEAATRMSDGALGKAAKASAKKGAKAKAEKPQAKAPEAKAKGKKAEAASEAVRAAKGQVDSDDLDSAKAAKRIVARWDAYQKATGALHDVNVTIRDRNKSAEEKFKVEIEAGIEAGNQAQAAQKLHSVVDAWQGWQEAIAEGVEERKEAKEKRTKAEKAFERAVEESRQLTMFEAD